METYRLYNYQAGSLNVPKLINEKLTEEYANQTVKYLIFGQDDVLELANDKNQLCDEYVKFMDNWKIPFGMYCYYGRFNSVMPETANRPNPKLVVKSKMGKCGIINQPAYGFLILNVEMLKSKLIKCDETYPEIFYLQDLAEKCMKEGLWVSNCNFLEIDKSWELFKDHKNQGYNIDIKKFLEEKNRYNAVPHNYHPIQEFLEKFKQFMNHDITITIPSAAVPQSDVMIDISKLAETNL